MRLADVRQRFQASHRRCACGQARRYALCVSGNFGFRARPAVAVLEHGSASNVRHRPSGLWNGERYRHDRIRLAYVSADFHEHPMGHLMAGLFERHDRDRFETIAVSLGPDTADGMRSRLKGAFERFVDVRERSDREVANLIRKLEIDIAVDRTGFTIGARTGIFALRPAPVQVNYLAYPGTMGADYIDYIVADRVDHSARASGLVLGKGGLSAGQLPGQRLRATHCGAHADAR